VYTAADEVVVELNRLVGIGRARKYRSPLDVLRGTSERTEELLHGHKIGEGVHGAGPVAIEAQDVKLLVDQCLVPRAHLDLRTVAGGLPCRNTDECRDANDGDDDHALKQSPTLSACLGRFPRFHPIPRSLLI